MEYIKNFVEICNDNAGFFSFILSALTLVVTTIAVFVAIYAARLPYKKDLKIYTSLNNNSKGKPVLDVILINTGNCALYLESIVLSQPKIMPTIHLGYIDKLPQKDRILPPYVPCAYKLIMQNYNESKVDHMSYSIKVEVTTSQKIFEIETDWGSG